jgi:small subunit ribosomal protein S16
MAVKIRLQRHGKKGKPFYYIVVADARARRDGKFIERLGSYNPVAQPAIIDLNVDKAVQWLNNGAQPTDTAKSILSSQGALYKKHLQGGVAKGAFDAAAADAKFAAWVEAKAQAAIAKKDELVKTKAEAKKARLEAEVEVSKARETALAAAAAAALAPEVTEEEAPAAEETTEETEA